MSLGQGRLRDAAYWVATRFGRPLWLGLSAVTIEMLRQTSMEPMQPVETLANGVAVVELLMAAYLSAQTGRTVTFPVDLDDFVPDVAQGTWEP